ncbi:MAG: hypothetical protein WDA60_08170 [Acidimicrobiia bacterium]|jgi:MinD-like ATPase involved in chromosome partitioning or flagellar assembly
MTVVDQPGQPEPEIALVRTSDGWVDELHRYCADHGGARVRLMVLDPAVALDEEFHVLVASDRWPALTGAFTDALHARGRKVLVVAEAPAAGDLISTIGVDAVRASMCPPSELVAAVVALVPSSSSTSTDTARRSALVTTSPTGGPTRSGAVVAVGGPFGAGSTEVAIALGAACARRGGRPVLVDADEVTPSVAARLGLPLEPNLCSAVDVVSQGSGAVPGTLFDLGDDWPAVLVGAPNRRVAATLRPNEVVAVGEALATRFAPVFVDVSAGARAVHGEPDVCSAVVRHASVVVAVGVANPVGVIRLVEWVKTLTASSGASVHLVVNRAPSGRARRAELAGELQRDLRVAGLTFVPTDPKLEDAAWSASVVERGPFARAIDGLAVVIGRDPDVGMAPSPRP